MKTRRRLLRPAAWILPAALVACRGDDTENGCASDLTDETFSLPSADDVCQEYCGRDDPVYQCEADGVLYNVIQDTDCYGGVTTWFNAASGRAVYAIHSSDSDDTRCSGTPVGECDYVGPLLSCSG